MSVAYWLLKSEPASYGWDDLVADTRTEWTGVRNPVAARHLREMHVDDCAFFYHSGKTREIVGIARVTRTARQDGDDPRWVSVEIAALEPLPRAVTLAEIKACPALTGMALVRQGRLSVSPVADAECAAIVTLAET